MKAMVLAAAGAGRVEACDLALEPLGPLQIRVRVRACGVCRTDLHLIDGELAGVTPPIVPGHEIVGRVEEIGAEVRNFTRGDRVGIPWLASTCGTCGYCHSGRENLCPHARFTGYHVNGGYAEYAVADARFCLSLPPSYDDEHAAPLLCAGLIGYRAYRRVRAADRIGIYGFGAAAHIITQVAAAHGRNVYAFVSPGDVAARKFAGTVGAVWAGFSNQAPPVPLDAAIIFAPVGALLPEALSRVSPGGIVVAAGIHMSDIPSFPYSLLWQERTVMSIANLTREDADEFLQVAETMPLSTHTRPYRLSEANQALADLRTGSLLGAAVLIP